MKKIIIALIILLALTIANFTQPIFVPTQPDYTTILSVKGNDTKGEIKVLLSFGYDDAEHIGTLNFGTPDYNDYFVNISCHRTFVLAGNYTTNGFNIYSTYANFTGGSQYIFWYEVVHY